MTKPVPNKSRGQFKKLKALGADKLAQIDAMLFKGVLPAQIATHIQEVWKDYTDVSHHGVKTILEMYRDRELVGRWLLNITDEDGNLKANHVHKIRDKKQKVDAHELLQELVLIQQRRLNKVYMREEKLPTNMDVVRRDIDTYGKLLGQLANLQMDLGFIERAPLKIQQEVHRLDDSITVEAERVVNEIQSRNQQAIAINKALEVIAAQ